MISIGLLFVVNCMYQWFSLDAIFGSSYVLFYVFLFCILHDSISNQSDLNIFNYDIHMSRIRPAYIQPSGWFKGILPNVCIIKSQYHWQKDKHANLIHGCYLCFSSIESNLLFPSIIAICEHDFSYFQHALFLRLFNTIHI